uniref:Uncharacterized protein n=1 Tax=Rhizophora mucronata TaxID=61149 RepID=A0A2P2IZA6_RHIMU
MSGILPFTKKDLHVDDPVVCHLFPCHCFQMFHYHLDFPQGTSCYSESKLDTLVGLLK